MHEGDGAAPPGKRLQDENVRSKGLGDRFVLTLLTDDPREASWAVAAGVQRIGPDLERRGKQKRQTNVATRMSFHDEGRLPNLAEAIGGKAKLFARINPIGKHSAREIDRVLAAGVSVLMLPYFHATDDVRQFVDLVAGRALTVALVETAASAVLIDEILAVKGVDEIHLGLTDMMISTRTDSRFRLMSSWFVEALAARITTAGKPLAVAGVARVGDNTLPIRSDLILAQLARLNASGALLTRAFMKGLDDGKDLAREIRKLRAALNVWGAADAAKLDNAKSLLMRSVAGAKKAGTALP